MFLGRTIIRRAIGGGRLAGGSYGRAHQGRGGAYDVPALSGTSRDLNYFAVSDIDIEGFVEENSVVFYKIIVKAFEGVTWIVYHRYSSFLDLYNKIATCTNIKTVAAFPPKHSWFSYWFVTHKESSENEERMRSLEVWLQEVVRLAADSRPIPVVANKDKDILFQALTKFFDVNNMLPATIMRQCNDSVVAICHADGDAMTDVSTM